MKTVQVNDGLHRRLKMTAANRGLKLIDLIKEGIEHVLMKYEEPNFTYVDQKSGKVVKEYFLEKKNGNE